jgi:Acetylornithine deacetylase/Succinyl-diaminopimelate desuccinylase and related deacylases
MAVGLLITGDEETGGENGAAHALGMVKAQYALALDGGSPERIITREKGIVDIKLTATGKSAHGARPWLGVNAIDLLLADYERIRELFSDQGGEHWHRSINFGKIRAGHSINQVPQTAEGWFDIRFTENDDPDAIVSEIRSRVHSSVEVLAVAPVFASLPSPLTQHLLQIAPGFGTDPRARRQRRPLSHGARHSRRHLGSAGVRQRTRSGRMRVHLLHRAPSQVSFDPGHRLEQDKIS